MDPQTQPPNHEPDLTAGDGFLAADGGLLELPLQEHHHRIIAAFMAEHQQDSSPNRFWKSSFGKGSRLPGFRVLRNLAGWLGKR